LIAYNYAYTRLKERGEGRKIMSSAILQSPVPSELAAILQTAAAHIAQSQLPSSHRSLTAKAYASAFQAFYAWAQENHHSTPSKIVLEAWRDQMARSGVATSTINTRLAALRKLLNAAADDIIDVNWKLTLRDWAKVKSAKPISKGDMIEEDYGRRLTIDQVTQLFDLIGVDHLRALRDRAVVALGVGAGLRVSEIVGLTVRDVFFTQHKGVYGIRVRRAKHSKARIVVLGDINVWVLRTVREYCDASGLETQQASEERVIRGVRKARAKTYSSIGIGLSTRQVQDLLSDYTLVDEAGAQFVVRPHDLRRTYAKLSSETMTFSALRDQLGHATIAQTERYVGQTVDWSERLLNWSPDKTNAP
jgi:site-specific recombinase XerD